MRDIQNKQYDTIAVDFDGTLCENRFPEIGEAKPLVIDFIKAQADGGAQIILSTCRENGNRPLLDEAVEFCETHGIKLSATNENPDNIYSERYGVKSRKISAALYIDDKAATPKEIEDFMLQTKFEAEIDAAIEKL